MILTSRDLIEKMKAEAKQTKIEVEKKFLNLSPDILSRKPNLKSWSAAEAFQHLLFTNEKYLNHFKEVVLENPSNEEVSSIYKHSFWGRLILYFVNPKTKVKSKTTKLFNPSYCKVETDVVKKYLIQHDELAEAIDRLKNLDLMKLKIPSPINSKIMYNLGDAIRIIVQHDQRHIQQAERALISFHKKSITQS